MDVCRRRPVRAMSYVSRVAAVGDDEGATE